MITTPLPFANRFRFRPRARALHAAFGLATLGLGLGLAGAALWAQVEGDRGIAPVATTRDITVGGVEVDVTAKTGEAARQKGWQAALRQAWAKIGGPELSDAQLEAMVASVVIEHESIGPTRYIARLGVVFDRTRAGQILGAAGQAARSAPILLVPVLDAGGTYTVYETRNPWQRAWADFQAGGSRIDYVRPTGAGGDSLLIDAGQAGRRSRLWWREVLDQFDATDVLFAIAHIERQWPGGPVRGRFTARHGPDNVYLGSFTMTAASQDDLPAMLDQARDRFDAIFTQALANGQLQPDQTLQIADPELDPAFAALLEAGRAAEERERAARAATAERRRAAAAAAAAQGGAGPSNVAEANAASAAAAAAGEAAPPPPAARITVQFATPDAAAVDAIVAQVRGANGVRSAATSSVAIGGDSVMQVSYTGSVDALAAALRARGFTVSQAGGGLSIRR